MNHSLPEDNLPEDAEAILPIIERSNFQLKAQDSTPANGHLGSEVR